MLKIKTHKKKHDHISFILYVGHLPLICKTYVYSPGSMLVSQLVAPEISNKDRAV